MPSETIKLLITTALKPEYHAAREALGLKELTPYQAEGKIGSYMIVLLCVGLGKQSGDNLSLWLDKNSVDYILDSGCCGAKKEAASFKRLVFFEKSTLSGNSVLETYSRKGLPNNLRKSFSESCIDTISEPYLDKEKDQYSSNFFSMESWYIFNIAKTHNIEFASFRVISDNGEEDVKALFKKRVRSCSIVLYNKLKERLKLLSKKSK